VSIAAVVVLAPSCSELEKPARPSQVKVDSAIAAACVDVEAYVRLRLEPTGVGSDDQSVRRRAIEASLKAHEADLRQLAQRRLRTNQGRLATAIMRLMSGGPPEEPLVQRDRAFDLSWGQAAEYAGAACAFTAYLDAEKAKSPSG
jgi:hypothetical protein